MLDGAKFFTRQRFQSALSFYMHTNESSRTLVVELPNLCAQVVQLCAWLAKEEGGREKYPKSDEYRCGSRQPSPTAIILMQNTQIPENI